MDIIRILIVDDHPMVRRGLQTLFSACPDFQVAGEAEDGSVAVRAAAELCPDVILMDIRLPGVDGIEVTHQLRQQNPEAKLIILTAFDNQEHVLGALRAGAHAYLLKSTPEEKIVESIRLVHAGRRLLSPSIVDTVLRQFETFAKVYARYESSLSEDDVKVLQLIARGATNEEIAKEMYWSERTVNRKVEEITSTLGARNRTQAVVEAIKKGLI